MGLSDAYEHLRKLLPDPEAMWITRRGTSVSGDSPPASFSSSSEGRLQGLLAPYVTAFKPCSLAAAGILKMTCIVGADGGPSIEPETALSSGASPNDAAWVPPDTFERKSTKFWAHPAVIPALQAG